MNYTMHFKLESNSSEDPSLTMEEVMGNHKAQNELKILEELASEGKWLCNDHLEAKDPQCENCKYITALVANLAPLVLNFDEKQQKNNLEIFNQPPKTAEALTYRSSITKMLLIQALASEHLYGHLIVTTRNTPFNAKLKKYAWPCAINHPTNPELTKCIDCIRTRDHLKSILQQQNLKPQLIDTLLDELRQEVTSYQDAQRHFQALQTIHAIISKQKNLHRTLNTDSKRNT